MSEVAVPQQAVIESESDGRKALATLPAEWRGPVAGFAMAKLYLLKTRGPLCFNLRYWISKGLTLDDAKRIFRRLCDPDIAREHNFENQLMADMAAFVAEALRRRRMLADMEQRRQAAAGDVAAGEVVKLADFFQVPK